MRLVRYGAKGAEKPALLDHTGALRDLSAHVEDITRRRLAPEMLAQLSRLDPLGFPSIQISGRARCSRGERSKIHRNRTQFCRSRASRPGLEPPPEPIFLHEGDQLPERARTTMSMLAARIEEERLGSRAGCGDRQDRSLCRKGRRPGSCGGICAGERRVRARLPEGARLAMGQGQGLRHVRAGRSLACHQGRNSRSAGR